MYPLLVSQSTLHNDNYRGLIHANSFYASIHAKKIEMGDPKSTSRTRSAYSQNKTSYRTGSKGIVKVVSKNAHISRNILQKLPSEVKGWEQY